MTLDINLPEIIEWARNRNIHLHPSVEVKKSDLGGYGLFATAHIEELTLVLRAEKKGIFDMSSLMEFKFALHDRPNGKLMKEILDSALRSGSMFSETCILRGYFWGFAMIESLGNQLQTDELAPVRPYLNLLLTTPVMDVDEHSDTSDGVLKTLIREKKAVRRDWMKMVDSFSDTERLLNFETAYQLHQAVKSRVLEIPARESDGSMYQFCSNTSLVPVLDFANHSFDCNAVFDILVEENEDVVLRLGKDVEPNQEITINYDPENNVNNFVRTYGFVPEPSITRRFTWEIPNWLEIVTEANNQNHQNYEHMAIWLRVRPEITIEDNANGDISIDTSKFNLPLLLIPGLTYNEQGIRELMNEKKTDHDVGEMSTEKVREAVFYASKSIAHGVSFEDEPVDLSKIMSQTGVDKQNAAENLTERTVDMLQKLATGPRPRASMHTPTPSFTSSGCVDQFEAVRDEILDRLFAIPRETWIKLVKESIENYSFELSEDETDDDQV